MKPQVHAFFHSPSSTVSYVVTTPDSNHCAIIDPVLDFDLKSGKTTTTTADDIARYIKDNALTVDWILETHVHADHLSAAPYLQGVVGGQLGIGDKITEVQATFKKLFNAEPEFIADGRQFDQLFKDGDRIQVGDMAIEVVHTPGHTPACVTYIVGDAAFVGDTLFMPDYGTARTDFPGGDATTLYRSIQKILSQPAATRLYMCHDYAPNGREYAWQTTVAAQRKNNVHVHDGVSEDGFVKMRTQRDLESDVPALLFPSIQVNMRAGHLPTPETNGVAYLKIPLNALG
jgi:glyoxylase-like metal-dependent hydrolase (beta-lactamase superfamily II)